MKQLAQEVQSFHGGDTIQARALMALKNALAVNLALLDSAMPPPQPAPQHYSPTAAHHVQPSASSILSGLTAARKELFEVFREASKALWVPIPPLGRALAADPAGAPAVLRRFDDLLFAIVTKAGDRAADVTW